MNIFLKNIGTRCALVFVLFQAFVLSHVHVQATTPTQYAEMATALATIPFDMAANRATLNNKDKNKARSAALLHITAETLGIFNKILFINNNIAGQKELYNGQWTIKSRDFLVNGAFLIRGLVKLDTQLRILTQTPSTEDDALSDLTVPVNEPALDGGLIGQEKEQEISKLAYAWRVVALPSLKGLTAFALACTQEEATQYSGIQARFLATATHSLVNLSEEYTMLKPDSEYKNLMAAMLFINTAWLVYELQKYISEMPPAYVPMKKSQGACDLCTDDGELLGLQGCEHAYCRTCLAKFVKDQYSDNRLQLDRIRCLQHNSGCTEHMSRGAMAEILDKDKDKDKILASHDEVARDRRKKKVLDDATKAAIAAMGARPCPKCNVPIQKNAGCDHMTCKCGHQYWWSCGGTYPNCTIQNCRFHAHGGGHGMPHFGFAW